MFGIEPIKDTHWKVRAEGHTGPVGGLSILLPRGSEHPISKVSDPKNHELEGMVFGDRNLKCWVLGLCGIHTDFIPAGPVQKPPARNGASQNELHY